MKDILTDDIQSEQSNGEFSHAMGVNTKPARNIEYNGYWIQVDPNMPDQMFNKLVNTMVKASYHSE